MDERFRYLCATLEKQLDGYIAFMEKELRHHDFVPLHQNMDEWFQQYDDVDVDEIALEVNRFFLIPKWDILFDADDHLDSGKKPLALQKYLISSVIHDLKTVGRLTTKYIPEKIVTPINTTVLTHPVRVEAMILELTAELKLCDSTLTWQEGLRERIRVAFYTMMLILNMDVLDAMTEEIDNVDEMAKKWSVDPSHVEWLRSRTIARSYSAEKEALKPKLIAFLERMQRDEVTKVDVKEMVENENVAAMMESQKTLLTSNEFEAIHMFFMFAMIICVGDDYIDREEDKKNFKTTGFTKAVEKGIPPLHLLSTTKVYVLSNIMAYTSVSSKTKTIMLNVMHYMASDIERNDNKFKGFEYVAKRCPKFVALFSPEFQKSHLL
jgi:hypothetical protein